MRIFVLWAALAAFLGGCAESAPHARGVQHLDLRLADGRSPALTIAASARTLATPLAERNERAERPAGRGDSAAPTWLIRNGQIVDQPLATGGSLRALAPDAARTLSGDDARGVPPRLVLDTTLDADTWDALEFEAQFGGPTALRLSWIAQGERHSVLREAPLTLARAKQRFELASHPGWNGRVESLQLRIEFRGAPWISVPELQLVAGGLQPGFEPLTPAAGEPPAADREPEDGDSGDMGLVALGFDARRAWPADLGLPLFARSQVPRGGVLSVAVTSAAALVGTAQRVTFAVDARPTADPDGAWTELARKQLTPPERGAQRHWHPWLVDLGAFAGREVDLRLRAERGGGGEPGKIRRDLDGPLAANVRWGAPMVLGELPRDRLPNLVLVTIDTTRADALGNGWTPHLDALASRGIAFDLAFSASESTTPSHATLLTGLMVQQHGALGNRYVLPAHNQTLPELLREAGYHTAAAVCAPHLQAGNGFGQGFDEFLQSRPHSLIEGRYAVDGLEARLAEWSGGSDRPLFLWLHLFDPHTPYTTAAEPAERIVERKGLAEPGRHAGPDPIPLNARVENRPWLGDATSQAWARHSY